MNKKQEYTWQVTYKNGKVQKFTRVDGITHDKETGYVGFNVPGAIIWIDKDSIASLDLI